jgi:hypothetical protein
VTPDLPVAVVDEIVEARAELLVREAEQKGLEFGSAFNRRRFRAFVHGARGDGMTADAKKQRVAKRRAKAKTSRKSRKANRS